MNFQNEDQGYRTLHIILITRSSSLYLSYHHHHHHHHLVSFFNKGKENIILSPNSESLMTSLSYYGYFIHVPEGPVLGIKINSVRSLTSRSSSSSSFYLHLISCSYFYDNRLRANIFSSSFKINDVKISLNF